MKQQLNEKFFECKNLVIQNLQVNIIKESIFTQFLTTNDLLGKIKQYSVVARKGIVKLQFYDHQSAQQFYYQHNFKTKLINRPFNIYFDLVLDPDQMQKLFIHEITNTNQRQIFDILDKYGPVKIYSSYRSLHKQDIQSTAMISYVKSQPFNQQQFDDLKNRLKDIQVKLQKYYEKPECCIKINNFYPQKFQDNQLTHQQQLNIKKYIKQKYKQIFKNQILNIQFHVSGGRVQAIIDFESMKETIRNFQQLRDDLANDDSQQRAFIFMQDKQFNTYYVLFTINLIKPQDMTDKKFQYILLNAFRKVNQNIFSVFVSYTGYSYIGKLYFKSQQDGKNFIAQYNLQRKQFFQFFKDKNNIYFNINLDQQQLNKTRKKQVRGNQILQQQKQNYQIQKRAQMHQKKNYYQNYNNYCKGNSYKPRRNQYQKNESRFNNYQKKQKYNYEQKHQKQQESYPQIDVKTQNIEQDKTVQQSFPILQNTQTVSLISDNSILDEEFLNNFCLYTFDRTLFQEKQNFIKWLSSLGLVQKIDYKKVTYRTNKKLKMQYGEIQLTGKAFNLCNNKKYSYFVIEFKKIE